MHHFIRKMEKESKKVAFYTLGCKLNFSETSTLARQFTEGGYQKVSHDEAADIYVINTCSVTEHADKKCRQAIRKFVKQAPGAVIAVTGCYAQLKPEEVANIDGVKLVMGAAEKGELYTKVVELVEENRSIPEIHSCEIKTVENFFKAYSMGDRTRSFLKVQDGCDYHCSYCTIPLARGKSRNIPIGELVKQAEEIAANGIKEIVLTGVNIGDFGKTTNESFINLIRALDSVEGIERYRISSIEPNLLTDEVIEFCAQSTKFLPHFHIPLQSGTNKILGLMRRRYRREVFEDRIQKVRSIIPNPFFGIDVIVGFPGETEEDFVDTYQFLERLEPAFLHIFPYSERANTPTVLMDEKVKDSDITDRAHRLGQLCEKLHHQYYEKSVGGEGLVLFESTKRKGKMFGFSERYIKVELPYDETLVNQLVQVKYESLSSEGHMIGERI